MDVSGGALCDEVKTTMHTNAKLTERKEDFSKGVIEDEGEEVGGDADEGSADSNGAEFRAVTGGVFVEGGEVTGTKKGTCGRRKLITSDDAGKVEKGREVGEVGRSGGLSGMMTEKRAQSRRRSMESERGPGAVPLLSLRRDS